MPHPLGHHNINKGLLQQKKCIMHIMSFFSSCFLCFFMSICPPQPFFFAFMNKPKDGGWSKHLVGDHPNICSVVEFQRWWVLKARFLHKNQHAQRNFFLNNPTMMFVKKCQNRTFKVNFLCQKSTEFFQKKKFI